MRAKTKEMKPRRDATFRTLICARISGCTNQKFQSNSDQAQNCRDYVTMLTNGAKTEEHVIRCVAKGEVLERVELDEVERQLRSKQYDFFVVEDLGRLIRDVDAKWLFGIAVDHGTRAISINDDVDTTSDNWEERALEACADHVGHNRHVSRRIKQKMFNRFRLRSELFQMPIAGYERHRHDGLCDLRKIEGSDDPIRRGVEMLLMQRSE